jgi:hypothetical protein
MPCQDYRDEPPTRTVENPQTKRRLDLVTRILCGVLTNLEKNGEEINDFLPTKEGQVWWENHKDEDRRRLRDEKKRKDKQKMEDLVVNNLMKKLFGDLTKEEISFLKKKNKI